ncbi:MAG: adenosylmethionine decarboxylase, partial [Actinobacteria bacterium]
YSGVCLIAESHVTIHTWPEHNYAAVDMFTCGPNMDFDAGIEILKKYFAPKSIQVAEVRRGMIA